MARGRRPHARRHAPSQGNRSRRRAGWPDRDRACRTTTAFRPPSPASLIPVVSIKSCRGPGELRSGMLTFRDFWRRQSMPKFGTVHPARSAAGGSRQDLSSASAPCPTAPSSSGRSGSAITTVGSAAALGGRSGRPGHGGIEPDRQRAAAPQRFVARCRPAGSGSCNPGVPAARAARSSRWIHEMHPPSRFAQPSRLPPARRGRCSG